MVCHIVSTTKNVVKLCIRPKSSRQFSCTAEASDKMAPPARSKVLKKSLKETETIPRIGLGMAALGRPGYINLGHTDDMSGGTSVEEMRSHAWEVLDSAYAAGVRYFDVARSYGKSEEFLSGWLESRGLTCQDLIVGSKWGYYYTADWQIDLGGSPHEVKEHSRARLVLQRGETQALLASHHPGYVDLYQIHSATRESGVLENQEVLKELEAMKQSPGWQIGLTLSGTQQGELLSEAMQLKTAGGEQPLFDSVQATWNLMEQAAGPQLLAASEAGMQVIVKEALANGRLTSRNSDPAAQAKIQALQTTADQLDTTVDALALACVLAQPFNAVVLSGAACIEQVQSNFKAIELLERLDKDTVDRLLDICCTDSKEYWDERSALAWN